MAAKFNFKLDQGADFILPLVLKDGDGKALDLFGYTFAAQVRTQYGQRRYVDTLTTENGRITVANNRVTLDFPHRVTEKLPASTLAYDLEMTTADDRKTRILSGEITVTGEVTVDV